MTRMWVKHRYFTPIETIATCPDCTRKFVYTKTSRPQVRCRKCQRNYLLLRMRVLNREYRRLEKVKLGMSV